MAVAGVISVPVYKIGSQNTLSSPSPTYLGIGVGQIQSVWPLSGPPQTVNGAYVYSVIYQAGTVQNPGPAYYTSLTQAQVLTLTG